MWRSTADNAGRPLQVNNPMETLLVKTGRVFLYPILGRAEGKEIGRVEATRSVIQSALALNLPVEQIAQICSCGVDRVRQIQASLEKEAAVQS